MIRWKCRCPYSSGVTKHKPISFNLPLFSTSMHGTMLTYYRVQPKYNYSLTSMITHVHNRNNIVTTSTSKEILESLYQTNIHILRETEGRYADIKWERRRKSLRSGGDSEITNIFSTYAEEDRFPSTQYPVSVRIVSRLTWTCRGVPYQHRKKTFSILNSLS